MAKEKINLLPKREKIIQILEKDLERLHKMKALLPSEYVIIDDEKERAEIEAIKVKIQTLEEKIELVKGKVTYVENVEVHLDPVPDLIDTIGTPEDDGERKMLDFQSKASGILIVVNPDEKDEAQIRKVSVTPPYINNGSDKMEGMEKNRGRDKFRDKEDKPIKGTVSDLIKAKKLPTHAKVGKATPKNIKKFLEASIKKGMLQIDLTKSDQEISQQMRDFLFRYGIGTDCTGLAAQAMNYMQDENLDFSYDKELLIYGTMGVDGTSSLKKKGYEPKMYAAVATPKGLKAGDIMFIHAASAKAFFQSHVPKNEEDSKEGRGKHVRVVTDVDQNDSTVIFMTVEAAASYDAVVETFRVDERGGVGAVLWRYEENDFSSPIYRSVDKGETWHLWTKDVRNPVFLRRKPISIKKKMYYKDEKREERERERRKKKK